MELETQDARIRRLLSTVRTIALVGASPNPSRPSNAVMKYLLDRGYDVYPVNPGQVGETIHGRRVFSQLAEVPGPVDMIDVFRPSATAGEVVIEAIALAAEKGITAVWMQLGVIDEKAAARAREAGLEVVMDRCPKIDIERLFGGNDPHV